MNIKNQLIRKIKTRKATIGIIGLGYVGLPLAIRFAVEGFNVIGFDIDETKVEKLNKGQSYIRHINPLKIKEIVKNNRFRATKDYSRLSDTDCIIICVPTPLKDKREPDLSYIESTSCEIAKYLKAGQLVSLESTTYPGTTKEILLPKFEKRNMKAGRDFFLVFSPEREDPGNPRFNTKNIPKIVGGVTDKCKEAGGVLYRQVVDKVVTVSSAETAEFAKLLENIFRSVNIALVNELKMLADKMKVDIWEIIRAAATKPFGFMPFYPGPGLGGHCIPIDPFYLSWKARELNFDTRFIHLAGEINTDMPHYVISKLSDALNKNGKSLKNARVLLLGVAYKKDIDDMRESPALEIITILQKKGSGVFYNDPYIPFIPGLRKYSSPLTKENLKSMDAALIIADHTSYDYKWIVKNSKLVIDTRNATKDIMQGRSKITKA